MSVIYATTAGKKALEEKLAALKSRRGEIAGNIKVAREFGDLKENAEYDAAREAQNLLETEIINIEAMLPNIKTFSYGTVKTDAVNVGTKVSVEIEGKKIKTDFVITGILEVCIEKGFVSNESPLGAALLGKKVGDVVAVKVPAGLTKYKILKIGKADEK